MVYKSYMRVTAVTLDSLSPSNVHYHLSHYSVYCRVTAYAFSCTCMCMLCTVCACVYLIILKFCCLTASVCIFSDPIGRADQHYAEVLPGHGALGTAVRPGHLFLPSRSVCGLFLRGVWGRGAGAGPLLDLPPVHLCLHPGSCPPHCAAGRPPH